MVSNITSKIKYIGVDDLDIDLFESQYDVPNGMSYNSYLILDEKVAIMDTCDQRKAEEWKKNLAEGLEGRTPDYLVVHHMEPDHAALAAEVLEMFPEITIVSSHKALQMMPQFFENICLEGRTLEVGEGSTLSLGEHTLTFCTAPMVHWPEVIVSYDDVDKVLFSADAFGKFGALSADEDWACEARRYYFNICGKYGPQVTRLLDKAAALDIKTICPLHGPILSENLDYYLGLTLLYMAEQRLLQNMLLIFFARRVLERWLSPTSLAMIWLRLLRMHSVWGIWFLLLLLTMEMCSLQCMTSSTISR